MEVWGVIIYYLDRAEEITGCKDYVISERAAAIMRGNGCSGIYRIS
jgi:hypothetical protein